MGSKQSLSNGNEPEEVTDMLNAFEQQNGVQISLYITVQPHQGKPDMLFSATAVCVKERDLAQRYLASANAICWGREYTSLMGVLTSLLYKLDFQLAEQEWGKAKAG